MFASSGTTPFWQARLAPSPSSRSDRDLQDDVHGRGHVVDRDAFAEVAELDHQDHVVADAGLGRGVVERGEDGGLGVEARGRGPDHLSLPG